MVIWWLYDGCMMVIWLYDNMYARFFFFSGILGFWILSNLEPFARCVFRTHTYWYNTQQWYPQDAVICTDEKVGWGRSIDWWEFLVGISGSFWKRNRGVKLEVNEFSKAYGVWLVLNPGVRFWQKMVASLFQIGWFFPLFHTERRPCN